MTSISNLICDWLESEEQKIFAMQNFEKPNQKERQNVLILQICTQESQNWIVDPFKKGCTSLNRTFKHEICKKVTSRKRWKLLF